MDNLTHKLLTSKRFKLKA